MIPTAKKIEELTKRRGKFCKEAQKNTEKKQLSVVRSAIRKAWMRHPVKLLKLELATTGDYDDSNRRTWKRQCEQCKQWFKNDDVQVDHIIGEHKMTTFDDIPNFARSILDVTLDDLQLLCKPCHDIKGYAEGQGITFEEARFEKRVIAWIGDRTVTMQKAELHNIFGENADVGNNKKRKELIREHLRKIFI